MLTSDDYILVETKLIELVTPQASPRQFVAANLPEWIAARLTEGLPPVLLVQAALRLCEEDGYNASPPSMCTFLLNCFPLRPEFKAICDKIRTPPPALPPPADPFDAIMLSNKLPFLGRLAVRAHLRALMQNSPPRPVVVIKGLGGAGKTYTTELINHICRTHTDIVPCHIEVPKDQGISVGPADLARDIVLQLGGDVDKMPAQQTNADRWAQELAIWIVNTAQKSGFKHWIVLDGFNKAELRRDTLPLIVKLSLQLTRGMASRSHRLILTDFDHTSLPIIPGNIAIETIPGLGKAAVAEFVTQLLAAAGRQEDAPAMIAGVTEDFADPIQDLRELGGRLNDLIELIG
ncbi:hypothetical protein [Bradyrhizobium sp. Ec3.3]|uniref:hypothetical protein n=1 Tax=Bradyrhizobium sp. Ec3.3 TaxID=189753 RepID=UPI0003F59FEB|nr:hypothetical protein [Bradyrhizobium sp. Ec3.3]